MKEHYKDMVMCKFKKSEYESQFNAEYENVYSEVNKASCILVSKVFDYRFVRTLSKVTH